MIGKLLNKTNKNEEGLSRQDRQKLALKQSRIIKNYLSKLLDLSSESFAHHKISRDILYGKVDKDQIPNYIEKAIAEGKEQAKLLREKHSFTSLMKLAELLKLEVKYLGEESPDDFIYFGSFRAPNKIEIYSYNIGLAQDIVDKLQIKEIDCQLEDIVLGHEIYHFLESKNPELFSNQKVLELWSIGSFFKKKSTLSALSEISSMAFCKELLELNFEPYIVDFLFLATYDVDRSHKLVKSLIKFR